VEHESNNEPVFGPPGISVPRLNRLAPDPVPNTGPGAEELEATWTRVLSIWWLVVWRGILGAIVVGGLIGTIWEFFDRAGGTSGGFVLGLVWGLVWGLFVVRMALRKRYRAFHIGLVPNLELTAGKVLSVWWLISWRGWLLGSTFSFHVGLVWGFVASATDVSPNHAQTVSWVFGLAVSLIWSLLVVRMALRKRYRTFRLGLFARTSE
jgi:hypothetical protein